MSQLQFTLLEMAQVKLGKKARHVARERLFLIQKDVDKQRRLAYSGNHIRY